ncbi:MAG: hypothetical protein HYX53_01210 [Chloroflexi bacterium]|nr:hypothetical protein [Chloroflexota bacterium]
MEEDGMVQEQIAETTEDVASGDTDSRVAELEAALAEREGLLGEGEAERALLLARLRLALIATDPAIPVELVRGETLPELDASFEAAREAVRRVRETVAREAPAVPAGAPGRSAGQPATAFEKIRAGMARL